MSRSARALLLCIVFVALAMMKPIKAESENSHFENSGPSFYPSHGGEPGGHHDRAQDEGARPPLPIAAQVPPQYENNGPKKDKSKCGPCTLLCGRGYTCCCTSGGNRCERIGSAKCLDGGGAHDRDKSEESSSSSRHQAHHRKHHHHHHHQPTSAPQQPAVHVLCGACPSSCPTGHQCCCTNQGTRCLRQGSKHCLAPMATTEQRDEKLYQLKKGVPSPPSIRVTRLKHHSFKVEYESGAHDQATEDVTTAIIFAHSRERLKSEPYLALGEEEPSVDSNGIAINRHTVRFQVPKHARHANFIYYRAGARVHRKSKRQSNKQKEQATRFYDRNAWRAKLKERDSENGNKDDPKWFSEAEEINIKHLLEGESGWHFTAVMSESREPEAVNLI